MPTNANAAAVGIDHIQQIETQTTQSQPHSQGQQAQSTFFAEQGREVRPLGGHGMSIGLILAGLGVAAFGVAGKYALRFSKVAGQTLNKKMGEFPLNAEGAFSKYYRGGFEQKMSQREAGLILGVSPSASKMKIKEAHKRIMLLNHPDRGGSPYMAAKINEAKDYMDNKKS